jgi:cytochrome oxidase Cu insertion factor (SCO1/SenC/PrrC family)
MNNRRKFLVNFSSGAAGLLLAGAAAAATTDVVAKEKPKYADQKSLGTDMLQGSGEFPEVTVETSEGKTLKLYKDLVQDKVVLIHYMSIRNEAAFPVVAKVLEIAKRFGSKLGQDVHIISITSDPQYDTTARLRVFAKHMGVPRKGWDFVRMSGESSTLVASRMHGHAHHPMPKALVDLIQYGNETVGLWGGFPANIEPDDAVLRVTSVFPGKPVSGPLRRGGPRPLGAPGMSFNNRVA